MLSWRQLKLLDALSYRWPFPFTTAFMATRTSKVYLNLKATHFSGGSRPTDKGGGGGGGGGGGHPDPDIREGGGLQKNFFGLV